MGEPERKPDLLDEVTGRAERLHDQLLAAEAARLTERQRYMLLPRWIVYFQAGLLGVGCSTFFVLGMMISQNVGKGSERKVETFKTQLTGQVQFFDDGKRLSDEGAVVLVLPVDARITEHPEARNLGPEHFQPTDNPAIEAIDKIGGKVVRVNREGEFALEVLGPREYFVLVISHFTDRPDGEQIPKSVAADVNRFFSSAEDLIGRKKYSLTKMRLDRSSHLLVPVVF
jgi:hypothetical protein